MAKNSKDIYYVLRSIHSNNNFELDTNVKGAYKMNEVSLANIGYYVKPLKRDQTSSSQYNNDWTGTWTGKNGINSKDDFLKSPIVQGIAAREFSEFVWEKYLPNYHKYLGLEFGGVPITKAGMIIAAHCIGPERIKSFFDTNAEINDRNPYNDLCRTYLRNFKDYKIDYSIDHLLAQLSPDTLYSDDKTADRALSDSDSDSDASTIIGNSTDIAEF